MKAALPKKTIQMEQKIHLDSIEEAIDDFRHGKMVIVVDDEDRENEGDLIVAAEKITPEQVNSSACRIRSKITLRCSARPLP